MSFPSKVRIVEVSPRDGLQDHPIPERPLETKIEFINQLSKTGLTHIEVASFVSPRSVPGMGDSAEVFSGIERIHGLTYSALIPNLKGLYRAIDVGVDEVVIFGAASGSFAQKNINCTIAESYDRFRQVIDEAKVRNIPVRGDIATALVCPYEGDIEPEKVAEVARIFFEMGCYEICLADTLGAGTPLQSKRMIEAVSKFVPIEQLAVHFHDTYGQALANIYAVMEEGVAVIDSSVGGLGGCPYARTAGGNVATEDVLLMLNGMGIETGVDLNKIIEAGNFICEKLGVKNASKASLGLSGRDTGCDLH